MSETNTLNPPKKKAAFFYSDKDDWSAERTNAYVEECLAAKDDFKLAEAYNFQGHLFMGNRQGDCREAFRKSIEYAIRSNHTHALAMSQFFLGMYSDDPAEHLRLFYDSLENMRKTEDRYMEAGILYQLGVLYQGSGDAERALELLKSSIPIYEISDNPGGVAWAYLGMANASFTIGGPEVAIPIYEAALQKATEYSILAPQINALFKLIEINLDIKNIEAAEKHLELLIEIGGQGGYEPFQTQQNIKKLRARLLIAKGDERAGEELYQEVRLAFHDDHSWLPRINEALAALYVAQEVFTDLFHPFQVELAVNEKSR